MHVARIPLGGTNAYVIGDSSRILIDTGPARQRDALLDGLRALGIAPRDLSLVVLTHAHGASVGNAAYLQREHSVRVAIHSADAPILASGVDRKALIHDPVSLVMRFLGDTRFEPVPPDLAFGHTLSLSFVDSAATVVHTPGHTLGSASVVLPSGDAIVGDLLMGGWFGGRINGSRPARHYFSELPDRVVRSLAVLSRLGVKRLHPGTGRVLDMEQVNEAIVERETWNPLGPLPTRRRERRLRHLAGHSG
jgi:hydroxyacylglutathione hydrolase